MPQVVIANRLRDGIVVFLGADRQWVEFVAKCPTAESAEESQAILAVAEQAARDQEIIDPMLIDVELRDGALVPVKRREAIRAQGPTIRHDLGKQAGN
jgi:hypothetical protein